MLRLRGGGVVLLRRGGLRGVRMPGLRLVRARASEGSEEEGGCGENQDPHARSVGSTPRPGNQVPTMPSQTVCTWPTWVWIQNGSTPPVPAFRTLIVRWIVSPFTPVVLSSDSDSSAASP